ncbi:glycosyltransferase [Hydrogenophilus hirschii]
MKKPKTVLYIQTYNQEKYIIDSLISAYNQDYENLTIYISDDASTDNTASLIEDFVRKNNTKHEVIVKVNNKNVGAVMNAKKSMEEISQFANLVVIQDGDDISIPKRASTLTELWVSLGAPEFLYIHTPVEIMDQEKKFWIPPINQRPINLENIATNPTSVGLTIGASSAYTPNMITHIPLLHSNLYIDQVLTFRSFFMKKIIYWGEPLLKYRFGTGLSNPYIDKEEYENKITLSTIDTLKQRKFDAEFYGISYIAEMISKELDKWYKLAKTKKLL